MKYPAFRSTAFIGAALMAFAIAYLAHTMLGVPRHAIRIDALGMAACLAAFIGAAVFAQRRG
jgi:asparagine N-glycosylation enzyme membrane subunit Stt3